MRKNFDEELLELGTLLTEMGSAAENAIDTVIASLTDANSEIAEKALAITKNMDQMERDIENRCLKLLLRQQPVAHDLRTVSAALKMVTDLQRIGDQCANIAEMSHLLASRGGMVKHEEIRTMAQKAASMVKQSIAAYVTHDGGAAARVVELDDEVDDLFLTVKGELVELMVKNRSEADQAIDLIIIAKYLERIADHAVNIAQWATYCVTGEIQPTN